MIGALIIVFREVLEAGLIVGIVWAVARNLSAAKTWIIGGALMGLLGSIVVAVFTGTIANAFEGYGQELFNAVVLGTAVLMLGWHNIWMARHGREMAANLRQSSEEVAAGRKSFWALAMIVGAAVMREGSEVVLFLYGIMISGDVTRMGMLVGGILGLCAGATVSFLTFRGLLSIPMRHFFSVTNWLITLLAAGMAAQLTGYLEQAGVINFLGQTVWDTSWILSESSLAGRILHTLVGYADQPTAIQLIAYLAVVAAMWGGARLVSRGQPTTLARPG